MTEDAVRFKRLLKASPGGKACAVLILKQVLSYSQALSIAFIGLALRRPSRCALFLEAAGSRLYRNLPKAAAEIPYRQAACSQQVRAIEPLPKAAVQTNETICNLPEKSLLPEALTAGFCR